MTNGNTFILNALASHQDLTEAVPLEIETSVNLLLENELTAFLDYEKHSVEGYNTGNSRNGYYERPIKTQFGPIVARIPRDRNGEFNNHLLPRYRREYDDSLETTIIQLYRRGITTREIADLIEKMYGCYYSPQTISNITKVMQEQVEAFHKRLLNKRYVVVFADATYINIRRETV